MANLSPRLSARLRLATAKSEMKRHTQARRRGSLFSCLSSINITKASPHSLTLIIRPSTRVFTMRRASLPAQTTGLTRSRSVDFTVSSPRVIAPKSLETPREWSSDTASLLQAAGLETRVKRVGGGYSEQPYSSRELLQVAASLGTQLRLATTRIRELEDELRHSGGLELLHQREAEAERWKRELEDFRFLQSELEAGLITSHEVEVSAFQQELAAAEEREDALRRETLALRRVAEAALAAEMKSRSLASPSAKPPPDVRGLSTEGARQTVTSSPLARQLSKERAFAESEGPEKQSPRRRSSLMGYGGNGSPSAIVQGSNESLASTEDHSGPANADTRPTIFAKARARLDGSAGLRAAAASTPSPRAAPACESSSYDEEISALQKRVRSDMHRYEQLKRIGALRAGASED